MVRTGQTSRITVRFDGKELASDVTAAQVAFWNAGRRAIRGDAILKPLVIRTANKRRILEANLRKVSRDVVRFDLDRSRLAFGEVGMRWNILEHNDGGVLQLIFEGDEKVAINAEAVLEGQPEIVRLALSEAARSPDEGLTIKSLVTRMGFSIIGIGLATPPIVFWRRSKMKKLGRADRTCDALSCGRGGSPPYLLQSLPFPIQ